MRVWDHVERCYIEVESVWDGRGSLPGDNGAGFIQRPGSELFRDAEDSDDEQESLGAGVNSGNRVQNRPRGYRPQGAEREALYRRILTEAVGLTPWMAARVIGCNPNTVVRARRLAAEAAAQEVA